MTELPYEELVFPELRDGGLRLRAWRPGDEAVLLRGVADDEYLRWNTPLVPVRTAKDAARFIEQREAGWESGDAAAFCVTEDVAQNVAEGAVGTEDHSLGGDAGADGRILGHISLSCIDRRLGNARVGYWVLPEARGRGVARRALELCSRWAFDEVGLHRIELGHAVGHQASCLVAQRCGYLAEGILRGAMFEARRQDAYRDVHLHARLATDPPSPMD